MNQRKTEDHQKMYFLKLSIIIFLFVENFQCYGKLEKQELLRKSLELRKNSRQYKKKSYLASTSTRNKARTDSSYVFSKNLADPKVSVNGP